MSVPADRWHPAIRSEPSDQWVNVLLTRRLADAATLGAAELAEKVDAGYVEARVFADKNDFTSARRQIAEQLGTTAATAVEPGVIHVQTSDSPLITAVIPRATKLDLEAFVPAREAYDQRTWDEKLLMHSWILDLGVLLCEPSIRFEGMGGECIWGCACWVVVPHEAIRGEAKQPAGVA
jgi:hypothetical protein